MKTILIICGLLVLIIGAAIIHYKYPHNPISNFYITEIATFITEHIPTLDGQDSSPAQEEVRPTHRVQGPNGNWYEIKGPLGSTLDEATKVLLDLPEEQRNSYLAEITADPSTLRDKGTTTQGTQEDAGAATEKVDVILPSGESIVVIVPQGMSDADIKQRLIDVGEIAGPVSLWEQDWMIGAYILLAVFLSVETLILLIGYSVRGNIVVLRLTAVLSAIWILATIAINDPFTNFMGDFQLDLSSLLGISIMPVVIIWGIIWILSGIYKDSPKIID